jgi:hypothetical protein
VPPFLLSQISGFLLNAALSLTLGFTWTPLHSASSSAGHNSTPAFVGLVVLYTLLLGSYWVCNVTTYSIPAAVFGKEVCASSQLPSFHGPLLGPSLPGFLVLLSYTRLLDSDWVFARYAALA